MEAKKTQRIYNLIILDASGSMASIYDQALSGVNETIMTIKTAQHDMPELLQFLTLVSFSNAGEPLEVMNKLTPIELVAKKTRKDYTLRGMTALYDAIGDSVTELRSTICREDKALVTIITDGGENDSERWTEHSVKQLVEELKEQGWVFTFIGANQDVVYEAGRVGVTNTLKFEATVEGTIEMFEKESRSRRNWNERVYHGEKCLEEGYFIEEPQINSVSDERITPERIDALARNEVFVFGSNYEGKHNGGAARAALMKFGAIYGQGVGLQGQSYAIPTTGNPQTMVRAIHEFIRFAKANPQMRFLVTAIGCGNAGWRPDQVAPIFRDAVDVPNITLPKSFWAILNRA